MRAAASSGPGLFACVPVALVPLPPLCTPQVQYVHGAQRSEPFVLCCADPLTRGPFLPSQLWKRCVLYSALFGSKRWSSPPPSFPLPRPSGVEIGGM